MDAVNRALEQQDVDSLDLDDWKELSNFGVDPTLVIRNLALSPAERLRNATAHARFAESVRARTVPPKVRVRLARARLLDKLEALGGADPNWPEELKRVD